MPIYGDGGALRDYIDVADHCAAIATVLERGTPGRSTTSAPGTPSTPIRWPTPFWSILGKPDEPEEARARSPRP